MLTGEVGPLLLPDQAQVIFVRTGILSDVTSANMAQAEVLYCQNSSDKHVETHLAPFRTHGASVDICNGVSVCADRGVTVANGVRVRSPCRKIQSLS